MLHAVLMVGGAGTRFWPVSRKCRPKYLLPIVGKTSMLRQTVDRIRPLVPAERILCVTSAEQAAAIRRELPELPAKNIIGEPMGRDSAACIALAAVICRERDADATMLCLPGDSFVRNAAKFRQAVRAAERLAQAGRLVTFGIKPASPETRFGYIQRGRAIGWSGPHAFAVRRFTEKPALAAAKRMLRAGGYYWNSGNFIWRADAILGEIRRNAPELHAAAERIAAAVGTRRFAAVLRREYAKLPKISIDYAVMEKAKDVAVIEAPFDWDDVGSWATLQKHFAADKAGNIAIGDACLVDASGCIVSQSGSHVIAAFGVRDLVVVATPDATLVCPKDRADDLKKVIAELERRKLDRLL